MFQLGVAEQERTLGSVQRFGLLVLAAIAVSCRDGSTPERPALVQTASPTASMAQMAATAATSSLADAHSEAGRPLFVARLACGASGSVDAVGAKNISDLRDVAVAALGDGALVTFAVDGDQGCPYDGCYVYPRDAAVHLRRSSAAVQSQRGAGGRGRRVALR